MCFSDLTKACDPIDGALLCDIPEEYGVLPVMLSLPANSKMVCEFDCVRAIMSFWSGLASRKAPVRAASSHHRCST